MSEKKKEEGLVIIKPEEFNIEPTKAILIQSSFMPKVAERDGYAEIYKELLSREISKELVGEAGDLRKKLVKVRTGIAEIHKTEKAFYWQAGKFVDALKNALTLPVTQMEEKLSEVESHYEEIERKEKEAKIEARKARIVEISDELSIPDFEFINLSDDSFDLFLSGIKQRHEDRIAAELKAEKERIEKERLNNLHIERKDNLVDSGLWQFREDWLESEHLGEIGEAKYAELYDSLLVKKKSHEEEQEKIRLENEKLKAEVEKREKDRLEKEIIRATREELLRPYVVFIRKYNELIEKPEKEFEKEFSDIKKGAQDHWDFEREEAAKKQKEEEAQKQRLIAEQSKAKELEAKLKEKKDAEIKAANERKLAEQKAIEEAEKAAKAPIKEQLNNWVDLFCLPDLKIENETTISIKSKFERFKSWAESEIEKM